MVIAPGTKGQRPAANGVYLKLKGVGERLNSVGYSGTKLKADQRKNVRHRRMSGGYGRVDRCVSDRQQ